MSGVRFPPGVLKLEKICPKCKLSKALAEFHWRNKAKGTRQVWCKPCAIGARVNHYKKNKPRYHTYNIERRRDLLTKVYSYLEGKSCQDCPESNPIVLEFDHVRGVKLAGVTVLANRNSSWEKIQKEIQKCEVVCANCHRKRTAERAGWTRSVPKIEV